MLAKLTRRTRSEGGFTLIELLIVLLIIGILVAIAVPAYLGFKERADRAAAQANVRASIPAVEAHLLDNGSYATIDVAALRLVDPGVKLTQAVPMDAVTSGTFDGYCLSATHNGAATAAGGRAQHKLYGGKQTAATPVGVLQTGAC